MNGRHLLLYLAAGTLLVGCASAGTARPGPEEPPYETFRNLVAGLETFRPQDFELFDHRPADRVYYGFDQEMAWSKRSKTTVDGDDAKPSQVELVYVRASPPVAVVVHAMYVPADLPPDVIGFARPPVKRGLLSGQELTVTPPNDSIAVYAYHHTAFVLQAFPIDPAADVDELAVIRAGRELWLELRRWLDQTARQAP